MNLDLAHLTWCSALDTQSDFMMYMQISPINILRYGTYVDIAAPLFSWPFLHHIVLPTLVEAQTGMKIPACLFPLSSCSVKACFSNPLEHKGTSLSAVRHAATTDVGASC